MSLDSLGRSTEGMYLGAHHAAPETSRMCGRTRCDYMCKMPAARRMQDLGGQFQLSGNIEVLTISPNENMLAYGMILQRVHPIYLVVYLGTV